MAELMTMELHYPSNWAYEGTVDLVNLYLERGASVNSTSSPPGMTPLHIASIFGNEDVCARLLDAGAIPSIKDKRGRTALAYATKMGHEPVRRRLLVASRGTTPSLTTSTSATGMGRAGPSGGHAHGSDVGALDA